MGVGRGGRGVAPTSACGAKTGSDVDWKVTASPCAPAGAGASAIAATLVAETCASASESEPPSALATGTGAGATPLCRTTANPEATGMGAPATVVTKAAPEATTTLTAATKGSGEVALTTISPAFTGLIFPRGVVICSAAAAKPGSLVTSTTVPLFRLTEASGIGLPSISVAAPAVEPPSVTCEFGRTSRKIPGSISRKILPSLPVVITVPEGRFSPIFAEASAGTPSITTVAEPRARAKRPACRSEGNRKKRAQTANTAMRSLELTDVIRSSSGRKSMRFLAVIDRARFFSDFEPQF